MFQVCVVGSNMPLSQEPLFPYTDEEMRRGWHVGTLCDRLAPVKIVPHDYLTQADVDKAVKIALMRSYL